MKNEIGVIASLRPEGPSLSYVADFGLRACQLVGWKPDLWTEEAADRVREESKTLGVHITGFWAGWPGPAAWNFTKGPDTLGIVPKEHRAERVAVLKRAGDFARRLGTPAVITHLGFLPENPSDPSFAEVVAAVREIAEHLAEQDLAFWFETGQETPVALLRLIRSVGTGNLGVNLDPANLILYGKGNPIDALDVFGSYIRNVHAKDGLYPTDPMRLGKEVKVGTGRVRFPELIARLEEIGFSGEYIIEREISGQQQDQDISATIKYIDGLLRSQTPNPKFQAPNNT